MWLDNLKELRQLTGMSYKHIAEETNLPERTVARIFSGDTVNPYVDTIHRIVSVLGGSLDSIFADSKAVVGNANLSALQIDNERLATEITRLNETVEELNNTISLLAAENSVLKDKVSALNNESELLRLTLSHKEEIISLHNYYNKLNK